MERMTATLRKAGADYESQPQAGVPERVKGFWADSRRPLQLLQLGLAFVFLYASISALTSPATYRSYIPSVWAEWSPPTTHLLLRAFAVYELALAVALLTRRFCYQASLLSAVTLLGIIGLNADAFEVLFRNVAITFAALALAALRHGDRTPEGAGAPTLGPLSGTDANDQPDLTSDTLILEGHSTPLADVILAPAHSAS
jgi:hypothetical protein